MRNVLGTVLICGMLLMSGCRYSTNEGEVPEPQEATAKTARSTQMSSESDRKLVHIVWFKLKPDADVGAMKDEISSLSAIDGVQRLRMGSFHDLGDTRAMSDLDLIMQMEFDTEEQYRSYQKHPVHLKLKQQIGSYIAGPPVTYDYWSE